MGELIDWSDGETLDTWHLELNPGHIANSEAFKARTAPRQFDHSQGFTSQAYGGGSELLIFHACCFSFSMLLKEIRGSNYRPSVPEPRSCLSWLCHLLAYSISTTGCCDAVVSELLLPQKQSLFEKIVTVQYHKRTNKSAKNNPMAAPALPGRGSGLQPISVVINMDMTLKHTVTSDVGERLARLGQPQPDLTLLSWSVSGAFNGPKSHSTQWNHQDNWMSLYGIYVTENGRLTEAKSAFEIIHTYRTTLLEGVVSAFVVSC